MKLRIFLATVLTLSATPALAAGQTPAQHTAAIQARGDADITGRTTALTALITRVNAAPRLTADQKASIVASIQAEISSLSTLKSTLDADSTADAASTDFRHIFDEHYVYAFYVPMVNRLVAADNQAAAAATLTALVPKLQAYIDTSGQQSLQAKLDEMKAKAADATTQANAAVSALTGLTAAGYPGNKAALTTAKTSIAAARADLVTARADAKAVVTGIRTALGNVD